MIPAGVQGRNRGSPSIRRPTFSGWKASTSFSGRMASSTARLSSPSGRGSCTRIPSTSSRRFMSSTSASSSCWVASAGRWWFRHRTPHWAQSFSLLRTYTALAGSSPTRITARPGWRGRAAAFCRSCSRIRTDRALPSNSTALMTGPPSELRRRAPLGREPPSRKRRLRREHPQWELPERETQLPGRQPLRLRRRCGPPRC